MDFLTYTLPRASINTNGMRSQFFTLERGTRQGCPMSPLLFALAIEPLSLALKQYNAGQGIVRYGSEHILSLYADDLLLFASNPVITIPHTIELLNRFGRFSGYKLNYSKSECFPVNILALQIPDSDLPFKMSKNSFKYLGVNICHKLSDLYNSNFIPLLDKLKLDLDKWKSLHITLAGRVNVIKMNVLPRFLYLFQTLPVFIPKSFFTTVDKLISSFIWEGKTPRIRSEFLQRPKSGGGLALPNLRNYYWAANFCKIALWCQEPTLDWCQLEAKSCRSTSLLALLTSSLPIKTKQYSDNPIVTSTLRIWFQFRRAFGLYDLSNHSPILDNHLFPPSISDAAFSTWRRLGLVNIKDLYINNVFASFQELSNRFNLPKTHLFRYVQVRNWVKLNNNSFPNTPPTSVVDSILDISTNQRGLLSKIYILLSSLSTASLDNVKRDWEGELGVSIEDAVWDVALKRVNKSSSCARLNLIQFKIVHRTYFTNSKLSKMYPSISDTCNRCNMSPADMTHMFWSCPLIQEYWSTIFKHLSVALNLVLTPSATMAIFGVLPDHLSRNAMVGSITFATLLARRQILLEWKSSSAPKPSLWLKDLMSFINLEKVKLNLKGFPQTFDHTWGPIINYISKLKTLTVENELH